MDIQGSIENYKNIFNLVAFNKVKENYIKKVIASRNRDPWFREIYEEMVRKNYLKKRNGS
jgi:hypothetical protein